MANDATEHNKDCLGRNITSVQCKHCLATADWNYVECLVPAWTIQISLSLESGSHITAPNSLSCLLT